MQVRVLPCQPLLTMLGNPHRLSQQSGRRFERRIRTTLDNLGFGVEETDETTGYIRGVDLFLTYGPRRAAVQCKATKRPRSLDQGFEEVRNHCPSADAWICIHSLRREGKRPELRILLQFRDSAGTVELRDLHDLRDLLLAPREDADLQG